MASDRAALRRLVRSDPVPANGPDLVRYMGGTAAATRIIAGVDRGPTAAERRADPEGTAEAHKHWRTAQRQAQRWAKGTRGGNTDVSKELDTRQRRKAQAVDRERKRTAVRGAGIRAQVTARIIIDSAGGRRDSRRRTITLGPDGRPGVLVSDSGAVLDLVTSGDEAEAAEQLVAGFLDGAGLPEYAELENASWTLWPDGEPEP